MEFQVDLDLLVKVAFCIAASGPPLSLVISMIIDKSIVLGSASWVKWLSEDTRAQGLSAGRRPSTTMIP